MLKTENKHCVQTVVDNLSLRRGGINGQSISFQALGENISGCRQVVARLPPEIGYSREKQKEKALAYSGNCSPPSTVANGELVRQRKLNYQA